MPTKGNDNVALRGRVPKNNKQRRVSLSGLPFSPHIYITGFSNNLLHYPDRVAIMSLYFPLKRQLHSTLVPSQNIDPAKSHRAHSRSFDKYIVESHMNISKFDRTLNVLSEYGRTECVYLCSCSNLTKFNCLLNAGIDFHVFIIFISFFWCHLYIVMCIAQVQNIYRTSLFVLNAKCYER